MVWCISRNVWPYTYVPGQGHRPRWRQRSPSVSIGPITCCGSANVEQFAVVSTTGRQLRTTQATTENINSIRQLVDHRALWLYAYKKASKRISKA